VAKNIRLPLKTWSGLAFLAGCAISGAKARGSSNH
jgi:hypothetical protein